MQLCVTDRVAMLSIAVRESCPVEAKASQDLVMWHCIGSAPYAVDLELAIIDAEGERIYDLPCRRSVTRWIDAKWQSPVDFRPTHWRQWSQS